MKEGFCRNDLVHASVDHVSFESSAATVVLNGNDVRPGVMRFECVASL